MKKFVAIFLVILCAVSISGCDMLWTTQDYRLQSNVFSKYESGKESTKESIFETLEYPE